MTEERNIPTITSPASAARSGSALIWATMVSIVLLILIGIMATVVQSSFHGQKASQIKTQAYYTAVSVNERIAGWLNGTVSGSGIATDQEKFIAKLNTGTQIATYSEADLDKDGKMGSAVAEVSLNTGAAIDAGKIITIKVTGKFAGDEETVVSTLRRSTSVDYTYQNTSFKNAPGDPFDIAEYEATEKSLNERKRDTDPVVVGDEDPNLSPVTSLAAFNSNKNDKDKVNDKIKSNDKDKELTFRNFYPANYESDKSTASAVLGTAHYPTGGAIGSEEGDVRQFVTPANGRWMLNPLLTGGIWTNKHTNTNNANNNTRITMLSMGKFEGKALELRLGGTSGTASSNQPANDPTYYNALMGFDFTDYASKSALTNPYVRYYANNISSAGIQGWYPQAWKSMTIYTQNLSGSAVKDVNAGLDARLVFGPYGHKYQDTDGNYIDYANKGRYIANSLYGTKAGIYNNAFGNNNSLGIDGSQKGMPFIPSYYGNDFGLYLLDNAGTKSAIQKDPAYQGNQAWITQGVNILGTDKKHSVLYSYRGLEIGGGLLRTSTTSSITTRGVNSDVRGMFSALGEPNYFDVTTRYSQLVYNTDIVLRAPEGTSRSSIIHDATQPTEAPTSKGAFKDANVKFSPTVKIIGGHIYVGDGHTLKIEGARKAKETLKVSPASITVASGGALGIEPSVHFNVDTDIFVSGDLVIEPGARVKGNIIVQNGGKVRMKSATSTSIGVKYVGDIYIEDGGELTVGTGAAITAAGIYVSGGVSGKTSGGALIIEGEPGETRPATITGDVFCAGILDIRGDFNLNYYPLNLGAKNPGDNPDTVGIDESYASTGAIKYPYHGIFLYHSPVFGTGKLKIDKGTQIKGNSGRIHAFAGYMDITYDPSDKGKIFCDDRDESNACKHWNTKLLVWQKQGDIHSE